MKTRHLIALFSVSTLLAATGCNQDRGAAYNRPESTSSADSAAVTAAESALTESHSGENGPALNDPSRKIIKTADLRCRVGSVLLATTRMERLAAFTGGQVSDSRLENVAADTRSLPYKPDSLRNVESYTPTAHLTIRIPVAKLDTVLGDIAAGAAFINSRNLHLDDVTLRYLSNKLKNDAMAANDAGTRARALAGKSTDAIVSGAYTDDRNDTRIDRRIENLQLADQVTYATLTLDFYESQRMSSVIVPDIDALMKPSVGQRARIALSNGWQLLQALAIGLLQIWPLLIIGCGALLLYRRRRIRRMPASA